MCLVVIHGIIFIFFCEKSLLSICVFQKKVVPLQPFFDPGSRVEVSGKAYQVVKYPRLTDVIY